MLGRLVGLPRPLPRPTGAGSWLARTRSVAWPALGEAGADTAGTRDSDSGEGGALTLARDRPRPMEILVESDLWKPAAGLAPGPGLVGSLAWWRASLGPLMS